MLIVGKLPVGALLIVAMIAVACGTTAVPRKQVRPAYAVRNEILYSFSSELSALVVRAWNPVAKRFDETNRVKIVERPVAVTATADGRFLVLASGDKRQYAIYELAAAAGPASLEGRLLWRGDASGELLGDLIADREGLVVVGRQKVFYLAPDRSLKYLGPGPANVYRQFSSVAVDGRGRMAINEDFGLVEYDITGGQLVERCRLQAGQLSVDAIGPGRDGWIVLGEREAARHQILSVRQCEASPLTDQLEPGTAWSIGSTNETTVIVIHSPGRSQSVVFVASERGLQRVELPFVPDGLLYPGDGPPPVLFSVGASGVSSYPLVDP